MSGFGTQKVQFGFSKTLKSNISKNKTSVFKKSDTEYVTFLEGSTFLTTSKGEENRSASNKTSTVEMGNDTAKNSNEFPKVEERKETCDEEQNNKMPESLDDLAVRELIKDAKNFQVNGNNKSESYAIQMSNNKEKTYAEESNLEDYESVPVTDFGVAMLRGMGWNESQGIGKSQKIVKPHVQELRPKGLGLGAAKKVKTMSGRESDASDDIIPGSFVVININSQEDYGKVVSLDEDNGRVVVQLAGQKSVRSVNQSSVHPVSEREYLHHLKHLDLPRKRH